MAYISPSHITALTSFLHIILMAFSVFCWKVRILSVMRFSPQSSCSKTPPPISKTIWRLDSQQFKSKKQTVPWVWTLSWSKGRPLQITFVLGTVARPHRWTHGNIWFWGIWASLEKHGSKSQGAKWHSVRAEFRIPKCQQDCQLILKTRLGRIICLKINSMKVCPIQILWASCGPE